MKISTQIASLGMVLFCAFGNFHCVERIDLYSTVDFENTLGISANLAFRDGGQVVTEVSAYSSNDGLWLAINDPYNFESVMIENSLGQLWNIPRTKNGVYQGMKYVNDSEFSLKEEIEYRIIFTLENGQKIYSNYEKIHGGSIEKTVEYEIKRGDVINIKEGPIERIKAIINIDPATVNNYYRVYPMETYKIVEFNGCPFNKTCYIRNGIHLDDIYLIDAQDGEKELKNLVLYNRRIQGFLIDNGYYLDMKTESLSPEAYKYWSQLKATLERTGNMFDPAPGTITTNLYNENPAGAKAAGYFYVTREQSTGRFFSRGALSGNPFDDNGALNPFLSNSPSLCQDCLGYPNSSTFKPTYWPKDK